MQGSALNYRSSFSRAVEMTFPTHRSLLISGTASIDMNGKSVHMDNCGRQIDRTMQVVKALLESRGMGWNDLFRGIAYFKNMSDRPLFDKYCFDNGIQKFPLAVAHTDICRNDLLFEIEVDAVYAVEITEKTMLPRNARLQTGIGKERADPACHAIASRRRWKIGVPGGI